MIQIKRRMDMIINALKADSRFEGVRFIREFTAGFTETPVRGFLASVCVTSTELSEGYLGGLALSGARGDMYTADAEIRIYAPAGQNGSGLSEIAGDMLKVIRESDSDNIVTELKAGSIEFDPNLSAVFRRVSLRLEFVVNGEENND